MGNPVTPENPKEKPVLSVIIKSDPAKLSFQDYIQQTLKSTRQTHGADPRLQLIIAIPEEDGETADRCAGFLKDVAFEVTAFSGLEEAVRGDFVTVIEAGDVINGEYLNKLLTELAGSSGGVFFYQAPEDDEAFVEDAQRISIFTEPDVTLYPRGIMIARGLLHEPVVDLLADDLTASGVAWKAMLEDCGYTVLHYEVISLYHNHPAFFDFSIKPDVLKGLASFCMEKHGCVEDFLQLIMLNLFRMQLEAHRPGEPVKQLLPFIDDENIITKQQMPFHYKMCFMNMKYDRPVLPECTMEDNGQIHFGDTHICYLKNRFFKIDIIEIHEGKITFRGRTEMHLLGDQYTIYIISSKGKRKDIPLIPFSPLNKVGLDNECFYEGRRFEVTMPVKTGQTYMFFIEDPSGRAFQLIPRFGNYAGLVNKAAFSYFSRNGIIVTYRNGNFAMHEHTAKRYRKNEIEFLKALISRKKYAVAAYRMLYHLDRLFVRKPIWILADRPHVAKDNGEHMFRYLQTTDAVKKNSVYFLIKKESPDYERLRKVGKVLKYGSVKHKVKFLQAQIIMCAAANDLATNALGKSGHFYRDFYNFDFVYLRHGVSHNDQSGWIHRLNKNIKVLVATCRPEYEGILSGDYDYTEQEVRLTGLPRFDNLYDEKEKKIAILPTWRKNIQGEVQNRSSEREYVRSFRDTDYFIFYDSLIHDERLLNAMEKYGYEGCFYLHPAFEAQLADFTSSRRITVGNGVADYQKVFRESAIMVTDYSSVAFDFAFLKKPVIYSQFDEDTFYKNHTWGKGYFTYREDGFGPITNTVEQTVDELIHYMENGAQMREDYVEKVENFFAYTDRRNCERVYKAVLEDVERKYR